LNDARRADPTLATRRSLLIRLAWRQSLLRLALVYAAAVALGAWTGQMAWCLLAVTAAVAARSYWRLFRVARFLDWRKQLRTVHGQGLWAALETLIFRRQTETRARARRLVRLLRAYRQAATAMPEGALVVDRASLDVVWFNKAAKRLLELRYPQSLHHRLTTLWPDATVAEWLRVGRADDTLSDIAAPHDPGLRLSLRLLHYSPREWLVVVRDVTQLVRLEQVRRDFVANVSHELRTPLTVIHGYLDMMEPDENPEWAPMVSEMRKQSQRMSELLEDLLTLSRLEAHDNLAEETVAMAPMLSTLRREAEALSQGRHTVAVVDEAGCDLNGSAKELHSAFSNLVSNAIRYTPTRGRVEIGFRRLPDGGAALSVRDSGFGIPAEHLPRLTERFYRVSTSRSRESGGTGLGLSIVKHILGLHQARLAIESEVGRGSTFSCVFGPERVLPRQPL
jgi:two-component system, OmpR family, phosphate regulon sensor histidine kinase PhoR